MKSTLNILTITLFVFLTGCVQSLHPLYTGQDLIFDDSLIGTWEDKESNESWSFSKGSGSGYKLWHTDADGRTGEFTAYLVRVENHLFLDIVPAKPALANTDLYKGQLLQTHTFARIAKGAGSIEVSVLEMAWLNDHLAKNTSAISHEKVNGDIVLTASPKESQKFLLEHLATRGAFSEPARFTRKSASWRDPLTGPLSMLAPRILV